MPRHEEPFTATIRKVRELRAEAVSTLCSGRWDSEAEARGHVGRIKALDDILDEMRTVAGPGTHFGEEEIY